MWGRGKLNNMVSKISEGSTNNEVSHEDPMTIINEEKKYRELKETIRMMNTQRSHSEKINLIEEGKKLGINEVMEVLITIYKTIQIRWIILFKVQKKYRKCKSRNFGN